MLWEGFGRISRTALINIGMDLTYAFTKFLYGNETVDEVMDIIEYAPHTNPDWDPFSVVYKVSFPLSEASCQRRKDCAYILLFKIIDSRRKHEYGFEGLCRACRDLIASDSAWNVVMRFSDF